MPAPPTFTQLALLDDWDAGVAGRCGAALGAAAAGVGRPPFHGSAPCNGSAASGASSAMDANRYRLAGEPSWDGLLMVLVAEYMPDLEAAGVSKAMAYVFVLKFLLSPGVPANQNPNEHHQHP